MSTILRADATGAVMLPSELCRAAGVTPGAEIVVEVQSGRIVLGATPISLAERIVARAQALPPDSLDGLPDDLASQHDHYLYGTPKQPE
jgi:antitoxin component of MazEF toxin-antitoxin module